MAACFVEWPVRYPALTSGGQSCHASISNMSKATHVLMVANSSPSLRSSPWSLPRPHRGALSLRPRRRHRSAFRHSTAVAPGTSEVINGRLTQAHGHTVGAERVRVSFRPTGSRTFRLLGTSMTRSNGRFIFKLTPADTGTAAGELRWQSLVARQLSNVPRSGSPSSRAADAACGHRTSARSGSPVNQPIVRLGNQYHAGVTALHNSARRQPALGRHRIRGRQLGRLGTASAAAAAAALTRKWGHAGRRQACKARSRAFAASRAAASARCARSSSSRTLRLIRTRCAVARAAASASSTATTASARWSGAPSLATHPATPAMSAAVSATRSGSTAACRRAVCRRRSASSGSKRSASMIGAAAKPL